MVDQIYQIYWEMETNFFVRNSTTERLFWFIASLIVVVMPFWLSITWFQSILGGLVLFFGAIVFNVNKSAVIATVALMVAISSFLLNKEDFMLRNRPLIQFDLQPNNGKYSIVLSNIGQQPLSDLKGAYIVFQSLDDRVLLEEAKPKYFCAKLVNTGPTRKPLVFLTDFKIISGRATFVLVVVNSKSLYKEQNPYEVFYTDGSGKEKIYSLNGNYRALDPKQRAIVKEQIRELRLLTEGNSFEIFCGDEKV